MFSPFHNLQLTFKTNLQKTQNARTHIGQIKIEIEEVD